MISPSDQNEATVDELIRRLRAFRDVREWRQFHTPKDLAISVSIEAAELLEHFQWRASNDELSKQSLKEVQREAADVLLYLLLLADTLGFNLVDAALAKIEQNEERFPVETSRGVAKPGKVTK